VDFALFLLLNGVLFIRPEELIPAIAGAQIYYWVILGNLLLCAPAILKQLEFEELWKNPVTVCVLGVLAAIFASHLARFDLWSARMGAFEFLKVALYFLLLMSVVNSKKRLLWFLAAIVVFTLAVNVLAVLQYHGKIQIEALTVLMENDYDETTGARFQIPRMRATGIFNDPNDLSMIIVAGVVICGAGMLAPRLGGVRFLLIVPIGFLLYALTLTQSRGGMLALLAGCGAMFYLKYGWQKAVLVAAVAVPGVLALGGRQTDFGGAMSGGSGNARSNNRHFLASATRGMVRSPCRSLTTRMFTLRLNSGFSGACFSSAYSGFRRSHCGNLGIEDFKSPIACSVISSRLWSHW
jgi:putative inorganic carbon (hco3(-)) transporter